MGVGGFADRIWISIFRGLKGWHGMAISRENLSNFGVVRSTKAGVVAVFLGGCTIMDNDPGLPSSPPSHFLPLQTHIPIVECTNLMNQRGVTWLGEKTAPTVVFLRAPWGIFFAIKL